MKKIIANIFLLGGVTFTMTGCNKFLSTLPDNRTVISTPDQVSQLLTSAYPHDTYMSFTEPLSDNAEEKGNSGVFVDANGYQINTQSYKYQDVQSINDDSPVAYFYSCYRAIAAANQALVYCSNADSANYQGQKGEALVCRAYAHFMLVTLFANAYDPATASSNPGIPYITTVETHVFGKYDRGTVQQDYDKIEQDLLQGISLIDEKTYGTAPKFHFTLQAAHAFASRFYLFKRDYTNVVVHANAAFGTAPVSTLLRDWNAYSKLQYADQDQLYTQASENSNVLLQETNSNYGGNFYAYNYGYGQNIYSTLFRSSNANGGTYAMTTYGSSPNYFNIPKFYTNIFPLLSMEEVLFNRTEANAMLGNYTDAVTDLNTWAGKNITPATLQNMTVSSLMTFYGTTSASTAVVDATLDFKRVSYLEEGLRWFDLKRLQVTITHSTKLDGTFTLTPSDPRRALQLPVEAADAGVPLNPRPM